MIECEHFLKANLIHICGYWYYNNLSKTSHLIGYVTYVLLFCYWLAYGIHIQVFNVTKYL